MTPKKENDQMQEFEFSGERCKVHERDIDDIFDKLEKLNKLLTGNGELGVCGKVVMLERYMQQQIEKQKMVTMTLIVQTITLIGAVIFAVFKWFVLK